MSSQSNGDNRYKIIVVETAKSSLRRLNEESTLEGKGASFLDALRKIVDRLRKDPRGFGEAQYRLPSLNCLVYQGVIRPLAVTYAVHDEKPLVFIRAATLLSDPDKSD